MRIDLREPRRELALALRCLRQIRSLVAKDPDIQGGDPVFKGTRVPVHLIENMLNVGAGEVEIREAYPRLTSAMIRLAAAVRSGLSLALTSTQNRRAQYCAVADHSQAAFAA